MSTLNTRIPRRLVEHAKPGVRWSLQHAIPRRALVRVASQGCGDCTAGWPALLRQALPEFGLLASRGSDFHCPQESRVDLGSLPPLAAEWALGRAIWPTTATAWAIVAFVALGPSLLAQLSFIRGVELIGANRAYEPAALAMIAFAVTWGCMVMLQFVGGASPGQAKAPPRRWFRRRQEG